MSLRRDQIAPVGVERLVAPVLGELLHALFVARRDRLQHGLSRQIEEPRRLQERIRMRPPHEAVANQSDIEGLHQQSLSRRSQHRWPAGAQSQPCASRTGDHDRRACRSRSCCCVITALGNMQPSQQMCCSCASAFPLSSLQPVAGVLDDVELAVGIVGQAVASGLVVRAGALHGRVVLRDVEVDRPRPQRVASSSSAPHRARPGPTSRSPPGRMRSSGAL